MLLKAPKGSFTMSKKSQPVVHVPVRMCLMPVKYTIDMVQL